MEEQRVRAGAGPIPSAHLGFVDATKGLGILAVIWGHMDYLWSTSSVWFSSFKLAVFFVVVGLLKARRYEARGQEESCGTVWGKRLYSLVIPYGVYSPVGHSGAPGLCGGAAPGHKRGPGWGYLPDHYAAGHRHPLVPAHAAAG